MTGRFLRRPDQQSDPPPSVVAPTQAAGILRARAVIIVGTGPSSGLFVYNGTPALGNPPQIAIVPTGVTSDPFGNAIATSKILMQGNIITETGGVFRTAPTAPLIQLDGPHNAYLEYNASAALTETIAPVATSDGLGNSVKAGFTTYTASNFAQLFSGALSLGLRGATPTVLTGAVTESLNGSGVGINLASGTIGGDVQSSLSLVDSGAGQPALQVLDGRDGNTWNVERLRQTTTGTQQFTLAAATAITGLSVALGKGTYHVRLKVFWIPSGVVGSTHVHAFAFTGTATGSLNGQCWQAQAANAVTQVALNNGTLASTITSPTHVAFAGWTELDLNIVVTVAGTLTTTVALTTAGDDITSSAGTFWEITPEA